MNINFTNWPYFAFILVLLLLAGTGEYVHIVSSGTFDSLLLVAIGLIAPSPILHPVTTTSVTPDNTTTTTQHVG